MNPIAKSIADIKNKIPKPVLDRAFMKIPVGGIHTPTSLDYRIREEVINARVIPDCNLVGGTETTIPLIDVIPKMLDPFSAVYRIPKTLTQNRTISRVLHVTFGEGGLMGAVNLGTLGGSPMLDAAQGVLQSSLPVPIVSTANVTLIGENTVLVKDNIHLPGNMYLRCVLEADSEFSHLAPASVLAFSKLVEYATKAYIYNNLIVEIDYAELSGGMALGRLKEIVEGYSDANELYETHFNEVWRKVAIFNDFEAHRRHLKMVLGGRW